MPNSCKNSYSDSPFFSNISSSLTDDGTFIESAINEKNQISELLTKYSFANPRLIRKRVSELDSKNNDANTSAAMKTTKKNLKTTDAKKVQGKLLGLVKEAPPQSFRR